MQSTETSSNTSNNTEVNDKECNVVSFPETAEQEHKRIGAYFAEHYPNGLPEVTVELVEE